ncbi:MAG: hypothetical protein Q9162_006429 [Coniocarpon cinnabarinum]
MPSTRPGSNDKPNPTNRKKDHVTLFNGNPNQVWWGRTVDWTIEILQGDVEELCYRRVSSGIGGAKAGKWQSYHEALRKGRGKPPDLPATVREWEIKQLNEEESIRVPSQRASTESERHGAQQSAGQHSADEEPSQSNLWQHANTFEDQANVWSNFYPEGDHTIHGFFYEAYQSIRHPGVFTSPAHGSYMNTDESAPHASEGLHSMFERVHLGGQEPHDYDEHSAYPPEQSSQRPPDEPPKSRWKGKSTNRQRSARHKTRFFTRQDTSGSSDVERIVTPKHKAGTRPRRKHRHRYPSEPAHRRRPDSDDSFQQRKTERQAPRRDDSDDSSEPPRRQRQSQQLYDSDDSFQQPKRDRHKDKRSEREEKRERRRTAKENRRQHMGTATEEAYASQRSTTEDRRRHSGESAGNRQQRGRLHLDQSNVRVYLRFLDEKFHDAGEIVELLDLYGDVNAVLDWGTRRYLEHYPRLVLRNGPNGSMSATKQQILHGAEEDLRAYFGLHVSQPPHHVSSHSIEQAHKPLENRSKIVWESSHSLRRGGITVRSAAPDWHLSFLMDEAQRDQADWIMEEGVRYLARIVDLGGHGRASDARRMCHFYGLTWDATVLRRMCEIFRAGPQEYRDKCPIEWDI